MKAFFAGDLCLNSIIDKDFLTTELREEIGQCEIVFTNLEGPLALEDRVAFVRKAGPSISQKCENISTLASIGFNLFGLANNHIMDCGVDGLINTMEAIKDSGAAYIGAGTSKEDAYKVYRYDSDCNISVIAVAENTFGCNKNITEGFAWMNDYRLEEIIMHEKAVRDYVFVTCHCGAELFDTPLPEVRSLYKHFIDLGADAVIGHHPHVCQGIEEYKDKPIFYSLGNFAFDDFGSYPTDIKYIGMVVILELNKGKSAVVYEAIPVRYEQKRVSVCDRSEFGRWLDLQKRILDDDSNYMSRINDFCLNIYEEVYETYIFRGCGIYFQNVKSKLSTLYRLLIGKTHKDTYLQWHNFAVETNRWIIERALLLKNTFGK